MQFKLNVANWKWISSRAPIELSAILHSAILLIGLTIYYIDNRHQTLEFDVYEYPVSQSGAQPIPKPAIPKRPKKSTPVKEGIFGKTKKSLEASPATEGISVKKGNTIAKKFDDKVLTEDDPESLPIPTAEYAVSIMPRLVSEVRIPYPPEAKKNSIEGPVVMDILVDQKGDVRKIDLIEGPGFGLNEAAIEAVKKFKFQPAEVEKKPVAVIIRYTYRFVLE